MEILSSKAIGRKFVDGKYLAKGQDEYTLRNGQLNVPLDAYRPLRFDEIEHLVKNHNTSDNWDNVLVSDDFDPAMIKNTEFYGLVRIAKLQDCCLDFHDLCVPSGITNCRIVSCDIGENCALHNVRHLAHFILRDNVILLNIDEMHTTDHAKFGNGIIKDGEGESVRIWLDLINEAGGRSVMPFDGMTPGDAYMWAKYRDDKKLMARFAEITQKQFDSRRGYYGEIGRCSVIKNCRIIKDIKTGPYAYIKGANKLKNLTINSSEHQPSQIGEGVELVNGIIGYGCKIFYGCKAVRFVLGDCSNLKYGARLVHSYLGDNSTISCCEVLNDLIFPTHEQHHNNSFLVAALVKGQSNIAAAATIGSNHNSRSPDGEIQAGRGFWPGLGVSVKHCCRFASFTLLAKAAYPAELDIPLPFSLVSNNESQDRLQVMPAYWWMYNMYALARNSWKFRDRDKRLRKTQNIEFDALAPDTAEEIFTAMELLELWTAQANLRARGELNGKEDIDLLKTLGRELLERPAHVADALEVLGEKMENSRRRVVILKVRQAYYAYRQMLVYYAAGTLVNHLKEYEGDKIKCLNSLIATRQTRWENIGGQLILSDDVNALKKDIRDGKLDNWDDIHKRYDRLWENYPHQRNQHSAAVLLELYQADEFSAEIFNKMLCDYRQAQEFVCGQTYSSRKKDYDNPFRKITFGSDEEQQAVIGTIDGDSFVGQVRHETQDIKEAIESLMIR